MTATTLTTLLENLERLLTTVNLETATAETMDDYLEVLRRQLARPKPNQTVIETNLNGITELLEGQPLAGEARAVVAEWLAVLRQPSSPSPLTGQRNISINGDAQRVVAITGDGNTVTTTIAVQVGEDPTTPQQAEADYRSDIARRCDALPLRGVDPAPGDGATGRQPLSLARVYIALDTQHQASPDAIGRALQAAVQGKLNGLPEMATRSKPDQQKDTRPLAALEAAIVHPCWVLLGKPGSGKTTFIHYLAHALTIGAWEHLPGWPESQRNALPVLVVLRDFDRWLAARQPLPKACPSLLLEFIRHELQRNTLEKAFPVVERALDQGQAVVLLDGLDEVPPDDEQRLKLVRDSVVEFTQRHRNSRHLITCRVLSYQEARWQLPAAQFPVLELAPFTEDQINQFIGGWYAEVGDKWRLPSGDADRLADKLRQAVRRPGLWKLAPNPLLLTVMALVHTHRGELPEKRALLYEDAVNILLQHWEQHKSIEDAPQLRDLLAAVGRDFNDLKDILERLAFTSLEQQGATLSSEDSADLHGHDLRDALAALHPNGSLDWAQRLMDTLHLRSSLLLERKGKVFGFPHRTFQEYLAGVHLARLPDFDQAASQRAEVAFWREVILLAVGYLVHQTRELSKVRALVEEICPDRKPQTDADWRKIWLAGDVLLEVGVNRIQDSAHGKSLLGRVRQRLTQLLENGALAPRERAEAGDVLGQVGDPRFDPERFYLPHVYRGQPEPLAGFVKILAGPFVMGSRKGDKEAYNSEFGNPATLTIDYDYWMARYLVTVAQFQCFIQAGGYEESGWWTPTGWEWRQGRWDSQVKDDWLRDWLKKRPAKRRAMPMWWSEQGAYLNRPVVGVSWFEAMAYCRWLDGTLRKQDTRLIPANYAIRLPTEAEWEKAARGKEGCRYGWGNEDWDETRANIDDSRIGHPSPVGMYPRGSTPETVLHDLSGNVWEWTLSRYKSYPYKPDDGRNDPKAEEWPVVRGGGWGLALGLRGPRRVAGIPPTVGVGTAVCG